MSPEPTTHRLDRAALAAALRARLARSVRAEGGAVRLAEGIEPALDRAALHEVVADDAGAAAGFCAMLLGWVGGPVIWIGASPREAASGLGRFGLAPARQVLVRASDPDDASWAMEEALRCPAVGGALLMAETVSPEAARRLAVAAGTGGALGLLLRLGAPAESMAEAATRWRVGALPGAGALGDPRWDVELLHGRGGATGRWAATWRASLDRLDVEVTAETPEPRPKRIRRAPSGR